MVGPLVRRGIPIDTFIFPVSKYGDYKTGMGMFPVWSGCVCLTFFTVSLRPAIVGRAMFINQTTASLRQSGQSPPVSWAPAFPSPSLWSPPTPLSPSALNRSCPFSWPAVPGAARTPSWQPEVVVSGSANLAIS